MNRPRLTAAIITAAAAIVLVLLVRVCRLAFDPTKLPVDRPVTELIEVEEEYVEFLEHPVKPSKPAPAYSEQRVRRNSRAAEATGSDLKDAGKAAAPAPDVTSKAPSPLQRKEAEPPKQTGPTKEQLEEQARRRAQKGVSDAFATTPDAEDNTDSRGKETGNSGSPEGQSSALDGTGSGSVGGGWIMPRYSKVASTVTGRIELRAVVGKDGHVISVEQTGGKAPAAANKALVSRCISEVKSRQFTRTDNDAPDKAIARIIYTFK